MMTTVPSKNSLASLSFPRTGKRGVPQQFPRRLYEMLDGETKLLAASADHPKVISWSDSGKAFRIYDVTEFAASVLPKYFRTKKFSSFQRNLNLYGFTKVRRGPETDMYAHEAFIRDHPDLLIDLRKATAAALQNLPTKQLKRSNHPDSRAVSPSPSSSVDFSDASSVQKTKSSTPQKIPQWAHVHSVPPTATAEGEPRASNLSSRGGTSEWGKLDLLAFALAHSEF